MSLSHENYRQAMEIHSIVSIPSFCSAKTFNMIDSCIKQLSILWIVPLIVNITTHDIEVCLENEKINREFFQYRYYTFPKSPHS